MSDLYVTLKSDGCGEIEEKKSVFIGYARRVTTENEAIAFIKEIKSKHYDARHNVSAYLLADRLTMRYSDDGEPQGSAGVPVLECIKKTGVTDACVVVTRYFGGILLGVGGLVRAYTKAAGLAIENAGIARYEAFTEIGLSCSYSDYQKVNFELGSIGAKIDFTDYADDVKVGFAVKKELTEAICKRIVEISAGRIQPVLRGERYDSD